MSSDLILEKVKFRNFQSFGNTWTEVDLLKPGTFHIMGENLDEGGSSGAGKSTIFNVITYCLYDKIPGDESVSKDKVINQTNEKKNTMMEVFLDFSKGDDKYTIRRYRGTQTGIQLFLNDKDITPANVSRGENNFNSIIVDLIGFSYNLFTKIVLFDGNAKPFLGNSVGEQRLLIEELFKITVLSQKAKSLKTLINETEKSIDMQKVLNKQQEIQNDTHRRHLNEAKDRASKWDVQRSNDLSKIDSELQHLLTFDFESEGQLHQEIENLDKSLSSIKSEVTVLSSQKLSKEREKFPNSTQLSIAERDSVKFKTDLKKIDTELVHLRDAKCPYCLQEFEDSKKKITELETSKIELEQKINQSLTLIESLKLEEVTFQSTMKSEIQTMLNELSSKQASQNEIASLITEIKNTASYPNITALVTAKNKMSQLQAQLVKMVSENNPHLETIKTLTDEGEIKIDHDCVDDMIKIQNHQQFLLKLLTDKNSFIRKNIISKTIPFLNKRIGYYVEQLSLPHVVLFQPDMSCNISQYGRELDHALLSKGEKKRLNLSLCLAFRDVLTYLHSKVNVLFADEVDGGSLDSTLVDGLISLLKHKAWDDEISIFTISHRPEFDGRCDKTYIVRKEGGFSALIEQPDA